MAVHETQRRDEMNQEARLEMADQEQKDKRQNVTRHRRPRLPAEQSRVYREALRVLNASGVRYAVGAAFARYHYTSIWRQTKDLDVFLPPQDLRAALDAFEAAGFETEVKDKTWLAKAWKDGSFLDLIFGTGHGQMVIDDQSFQGVAEGKVLGVPTHLIPLEEMIASAAYVAGRNRFDGPEILHLIHSVKGKLNWQRILDRLGENRELLLWHLILFNFVFPGHASYLPKDLMVELFREAQERWKKRGGDPKRFRGTLLDPFSYTVDVEDWGYEDRRSKEPLVDQKGNAL